MAKRMKPGFSLELNQVIEWIMPLRHPSHRIGIACAVSHPTLAPYTQGKPPLLSSCSPNRTRRGTNVSLGWQGHHGAILELYGLRLNPMGA